MNNENINETSINENEVEIVNEDIDNNINSDDKVSTEKSNWFVVHCIRPLLKYLKGIAFDLKRDVSENPNIIFGLCLMIPAVLVGFMLSTHITASGNLTNDYNNSGFQMFVLEMAGCLNVVWGFGIIKKRNLKSSIFALITTAILVTCGILWCRAFVTCKYPDPNDDTVIVTAFEKFSSCKVSFVSVIISCAFAVIGTIGSFFFRNKNYKKETL